MNSANIHEINDKLNHVRLVDLYLPKIIKQTNEEGIFEDKTCRIIREVQFPSEIKAVFTENNKSVEIYKDANTSNIFNGNVFYKRAWLIWDSTHKIMEGRTLKQKLGDVSTDFFLEKFTDNTYADYFKSFYKPLSELLQEYASVNNLRIPEDICLFYKGGNLFRIILSKFVTFLDNEDYKKLMKNRSDADFQIFINPDIANYEKVLNDISVRVLYILYKYRENLTKSGILNHNLDELCDKYIEKINEYNIPLDREKVNIATKNVKVGEEFKTVEKSNRGDFIMNTFKMDNGIEKIAYTEEYSLLKKNDFYNIDKKIVDPSLYVSRNITSDFETFSNKRYLFELIRLKRNIRIEIFPKDNKILHMMVPSEMIDVSIPRVGDSSLEIMKKDIHHYIQQYNYIEPNTPIPNDDINKNSFPFYGVTLDYLIYDLNDILFYKFVFPWLDPKYEKRFTRYFICLLLSIIVMCYSRRGCNIKKTIIILRSDLNLLKSYIENHNLNKHNSKTDSKNIKDNLLRHIYENYIGIYDKVNNPEYNEIEKNHLISEFRRYSFKLIDWLNILINMSDLIARKIAESDTELYEIYDSLFVKHNVNMLGGKGVNGGKELNSSKTRWIVITLPGNYELNKYKNIYSVLIQPIIKKYNGTVGKYTSNNNLTESEHMFNNLSDAKIVATKLNKLFKKVIKEMPFLFLFGKEHLEKENIAFTTVMPKDYEKTRTNIDIELKTLQGTKILHKKYLERISPPYPAKDYPNEIILGNDGHKYKSISNKKNIYTWKKM